MTTKVLDYAPPPEFDTGRFVARYLQVLACLMVARMVGEPTFFDRLEIDLTFILLLWAASGLKRRSRTARGWVLAISGLFLSLSLYLHVFMILSIPAGRSTSFFGGMIKDPPRWVALLIQLGVIAVYAVPFGVLLSPRAQRQFGAIP